MCDLQLQKTEILGASYLCHKVFSLDKVSTFNTFQFVDLLVKDLKRKQIICVTAHNTTLLRAFCRGRTAGEVASAKALPPYFEKIASGKSSACIWLSQETSFYFGAESLGKLLLPLLRFKFFSLNKISCCSCSVVWDIEHIVQGEFSRSPLLLYPVLHKGDFYCYIT